MFRCHNHIQVARSAALRSIRLLHNAREAHSEGKQIVAIQKYGHKQFKYLGTTPKSLTLQHEPQISLATKLQTTVRSLPLYLENLFLPRDYETTTTKDYLPYAKWQFVGSVAGTASGVLSMQSLLYAIGLQSGAIPMAAALNWVIKDGLGQFGGVLFASLVNHRFDSDPKRWRMVSTLAMDAATLTEILTPLCPAYFLPMAAMANVAKNISWLSASATRAGFHYSFAKNENLADITAKAGSQSIASSIIGTAVGIAISPIIGTTTSHVVGAFFVLSSINIWSLYNSLKVISLRTLNQQRLNHVLDHYLVHKTIPTPQDISEKEIFISNLLSGRSCCLTKSTLSMASRLDQVYTPNTLVYPNEKYLLHATESNGKLLVHLLMETTASNHDVFMAQLHARIVQRTYESSTSNLTMLLKTSYEQAKSVQSDFLDAIQTSSWHCENLLIEEFTSRYTFNTN